MSELEDILIERIRANGPMPFAAYMQLALYHPQHGYYASEPRTGWAGDFITSPEIDPAYGHLWARAFEKVWVEVGRPEGFTIVEVGPGEGGFSAAVLEALDARLRRDADYVLVERMPHAEARQRAALNHQPGVRWVRSLIDLRPSPAGVVFANEVLDNAPVHVVEARGGRLLEVCVSVRGDELVEELLPPSNPELAAFARRTGVEVPEGTRYEIGLAAESMARRLATVIGRGAIFFVDYGDTAGALVERPEGTLVGYGPGGPTTQVLVEPGTRDITSHANWTAIAGVLAAAAMDVHGPIPQADVLRALGLGTVDDGLRRAHDDALKNKDGSGAVAALSRRQALRALVDPGGLGGLQVVAGSKGIAFDWARG